MRKKKLLRILSCHRANPHVLKLKPAKKNNIRHANLLAHTQMKQMHIKPKHVKLLRRAMFSPLRILCLLPIWKSDATEINLGGTMQPRPGRASWQPAKPGPGERFLPMGNCVDRDRQIILVKMCPFVTENKSNFVIETSQPV